MATIDEIAKEIEEERIYRLKLQEEIQELRREVERLTEAEHKDEEEDLFDIILDKNSR